MLASADRLLGGDLATIDAVAADLRLTESGRDLTAAAPPRLLFDNRSLATYLVYWADRTAQPVELSLMTSSGTRPTARDLVTGLQLGVSDYSRDAATGRVRATVSQASGPVFVDFTEEGAQPFVERSGVTAARTPTIGEIIALHQRQQRAQDTLVQNYIAHARMEQHFRPTVADPGYDIVTENRYYVDRGGVEWEELTFSVNGAKWGADRPPLPLLQPEKVLSLPLQLRFDEGYRYRLAGTEQADGYDCFVVRFEPARPDPSLYRGTVWIDRKTFARIRVQAVQGGLLAPVVSNEETQYYTKVSTLGDQPVFLFTELSARQIVLIAGRNLLVEKKVTFSEFRVNRAGVRRGAGGGARERSHHVPGDRRRLAPLRQTGRRPCGERRADAERQSHGDGRDHRSVVCVSPAHLRDQLRGLRVRQQEHADGDAVWRRARGDQRAAARSSAGPPWTPAWISSRLPFRRATGSTTFRVNARASGC